MLVEVGLHAVVLFKFAKKRFYQKGKEPHKKCLAAEPFSQLLLPKLMKKSFFGRQYF